MSRGADQGRIKRESYSRIPEIMELNIGHFLIGEAIYIGLDAAVRRMKALMAQARAA